MKMTILLSSVFAVGVAFADANDAAVTSTEIGVMGIAKPTSKTALIAVPFKGNASDAIVVADMINTAELRTGTKLYVASDSTGNNTYEVWTLSSTKQWEKADNVIVIGKDGSTSDGAASSATDVTVAQGGAFWLEPAASETEGTFYLLGQMGDAGASTAVGGKWNLIGNTSGAKANLKDLGGTTGDQIVLPLTDGKLRYYTYKATKGWRYQTSTGAWSVPANDPLTVDMGQGIWYKPQTDSTINWSQYVPTADAQ